MTTKTSPIGKTKAEKIFDAKVSAAIDAHDWDQVERLFAKLACVFELLYGEGEAGYEVYIRITPEGVSNVPGEDDVFMEEEPIGDYLGQLGTTETAVTMGQYFMTSGHPTVDEQVSARLERKSALDTPELMSNFGAAPDIASQSDEAEALGRVFDILDGKCVYLPTWTEEVGDIDICQNHMNNSKHPASAGKNRPCLTVDPYSGQGKGGYEFAGDADISRGTADENGNVPF